MFDLLHLLLDVALVEHRRPRVWRVHPAMMRHLKVEIEAIHWSFVYNPANPVSLCGLPLVVDEKTVGIILESD